jgi:hypothetical protein
MTRPFSCRIGAVVAAGAGSGYFAVVKYTGCFPSRGQMAILAVIGTGNMAGRLTDCGNIIMTTET